MYNMWKTTPKAGQNLRTAVRVNIHTVPSNAQAHTTAAETFPAFSTRQPQHCTHFVHRTKRVHTWGKTWLSTLSPLSITTTTIYIK